jgi:hypothetical protein
MSSAAAAAARRASALKPVLKSKRAPIKAQSQEPPPPHGVVSGGLLDRTGRIKEYCVSLALSCSRFFYVVCSSFPAQSELSQSLCLFEPRLVLACSPFCSWHLWRGSHFFSLCYRLQTINVLYVTRHATSIATSVSSLAPNATTKCISTAPRLFLLTSHARLTIETRCESCIDRIYMLGPEPCPTCGTVLRKNNFAPQTFENLAVEKEVKIRSRMAKL